MKRDLPTPAAMYGRLVAAGLSVGGLVVAGAVPLGRRVGPLPQGGEGGDLARLALILFVLLAVAVMVAAAVVVRRTTSLYRALLRAGPPEDAEAPPPSVAALRDAFEAPRWMAGVTGAFLVGAIALHLSGSLLWPELLGGRRVVFDLVAASLLALGAGPATLLWRRSMWGWLGHVDPLDVPRAGRASVRRRLTLAVGTPVLALVLAALAVLLAGAQAPGIELPPPLVLGVGVALAGVGVAALVASRVLAWQLARDLRVVEGRVLQALEPAGAPGPPASRPAPRHAAVTGLCRRVDELAARHARSVAEEERAREAIEEVQQLKSRFMAYMSHDLRSPLNSIKGFAEILARGTDGPLTEGQHESVAMIRESGDALLRLVGDILDSAKLEAGQLDLVPRWIPSVEILTEAVREAKELGGGDDLQIVTELEPGLPPVHVDRERIVQAVSGILIHVARSMPKGTIRLRARVVGGDRDGEASRHLRVEVIDESASLGPDDRERLFETLRAIREPSGRRIGGLGLGLSLARGLVTAHGGDVWYERYGDRGTSFCASLPLTVAEGP
ncbi:MAG: sensor histidine kinase [Myxococcota bacterium]